MSVIIRLQNLPWSANALDIRNYFRGLSIPEGGVHIVGGELGDAFIAFRSIRQPHKTDMDIASVINLLSADSTENRHRDIVTSNNIVDLSENSLITLDPVETQQSVSFTTDEDARQAMMLDCGKIKEIQVKLLLSSRSEMHKVIEQARQTVPILTLTAPAPAPAPPPPAAVAPFSAALGSVPGFGIPGIGNPSEIPQPAVIEPPAPLVSPTEVLDDNDDRPDRKRSKEKDRRRSRTRSRSRDRERKDRKRDRRDRSRSRERRRRDRSRSRERRDRKRDRNNRSRSRDRSERASPRRSHDRRARKSPDNTINLVDDVPAAPPAPVFGNVSQPNPNMQQIMNNAIASMQQNQNTVEPSLNRFADPAIHDAYNKLNELGKKRNPNAFQGDQNGGSNRFPGRGGANRGSNAFRRDGRSRFENDNQQHSTPDCCVAIRNAPNHTSYGDVRRFFPFLIDKHGIKMINDNTGRRTGNIFVRFCDPRSKQLALQRKINELKGETVVVEALEDETYESAVDSYMPFRDDNNADREDNQPRIPPPQAIPFCSVLRLTELPNFVKEHDIIKAFSDFSLLSIMLNDCRLTKTKTAYVQFAKPDEARLAFERRNNYAFGKRLPIIAAVSDEDYEKEKAMQMQAEKIEFPAEEPRAAEPAAPRDPRQRRLEPPAPAPPAPPAQPAPFPAPPFVPPQPFGGGFPAPHFGGFPAAGAVDPRAAAAAAAAAGWAGRPGFPGPLHNLPPAGPDMDEELDCVLMKGLPCDATDRTIVTFLSDTGAVPARIHLMLDPAGVPSGDCFCEFRTASEARAAAAKHGQNLEGCRVTVDLVPRGVVEEALEGPKQHDPRDGHMDNGHGLLGNGPHSNGPPQFYDGPRGAKRGGFRGRGFDRGGFDRGGFDRGYDRGGYNRGGFDQSRGWADRGRGGFDRGHGRGRGGFEPRGRGRGRGRGGFDSGRDLRDTRDTRDMREDDDTALEDFGAPGCVLSLENVPFRASVDDILSFFGEFELTQDDVIRRYNERGQPTGDARVSFRTPFDAQRALNTRHMNTLQDRRVSLSLL